ncbi:hypothetical protein GCM10010430_48890 [Kitasatospora cystarginea]|uniref:Uncharacterized protein n=2 Tax=Kitasatospora cystarginea TaxID=58350 RepID=A0ABN3EH55_9ACTN
MDQSLHAHSFWKIEGIEAFIADLRPGQQLEQIREVAQSHAYRSDEPRHVRLRWAKASLTANKRLHDGRPWQRARMLSQDFGLRTWVIEHLGPDTDPDWNPDVLAKDTLGALSLDPRRAEAESATWRDLPIEQIGELRRHKNLTAHVARLVPSLQPGPIKDQLTAWASVHECLP